jgi:hypothetical protein
MWFQIVDNLTNLKSKYNIVKNLLKDTNNKLHAYCLELVNHKQVLQNRDKDLTTVKTKLFKLQANNNILLIKVLNLNNNQEG